MYSVKNRRTRGTFRGIPRQLLFPGESLIETNRVYIEMEGGRRVLNHGFEHGIGRSDVCMDRGIPTTEHHWHFPIDASIPAQWTERTGSRTIWQAQ